MNDLPEKYDPDFPYPPIFEPSESQPDPAWDYLEVWGRLKMIQEQAEHIKTFLELDAAEYRSPAMDQTIREHLRQINAQSQAIMALLDES